VLLLTIQQAHAPTAFRVLHQLREPTLAGFLLLRTHDPESHQSPVTGRLLLEEVPRSLIRLELPLQFWRQFARSVLKRIHARPRCRARGKRFLARGHHATGLLQTLYVTDVDETPDTVWFSRRESLREAQFIHAFPDAINPAKAQRLVQRFCVGDADLTGILLVNAEPQFSSVGVIRLQPDVEVGGGFEVFEFHRGSHGVSLPLPFRPGNFLGSGFRAAKTSAACSGAILE